ncbi:hypothetical protein KGF56_003909 [Candida oxycetoniae]|uniref:GSKIP domain-containing protein n=1 Tax=Candida oxycetoniae TaxID=497107 RepID=A0AAI9SUJ0_9ASCO|nr:uncharacterized protein KGF56_003909 [Candida oxycetoniae]KAI3403321.1 hypothetical protein KGF56_003909 [Candida oxycetoniae]
MDRQQLQKELKSICNEYSAFFLESQLFLDDPLSADHLRVETLEGITIKVTVDLAGWHQLGASSTQHYETFEAMMQTLSPSFKESFANALIDKLNKHLAC